MSTPTLTRLRARALDGAAWLALYQGDLGGVESPDRGCAGPLPAARTRRASHPDSPTSVLSRSWDSGTTYPCRGVLEELGELKPQLKNRNTLAYLLMLEGMIAMSRGDLEHSVTLHEQSLQLFREIQNTQGMITVPGPPWPPGIDPGRLRESPYTAAGKPAPGVGVGLQTEHPTLPPHSGVCDRLPGAAGPSR